MHAVGRHQSNPVAADCRAQGLQFLSLGEAVPLDRLSPSMAGRANGNIECVTGKLAESQSALENAKKVGADRLGYRVRSGTAESIGLALLAVIAERLVEFCDPASGVCQQSTRDLGIGMVEDEAEVDPHRDLFKFMPLRLGTDWRELAPEEQRQTGEGEESQVQVRRP